MSNLATFSHANSGLQAGVINGSVSTSFHLSAVDTEQSVSPIRPSATIPFSRDDDFVERGDLLNRIQSKCAIPGSRTALFGLGGVGKSQLAIEFAYRSRERLSEKWVFWAHASNAVRLEQSYREIASLVKAPGWQDKQADVFEIVHNWLRDNRNEQWLLILDNVDDANFLLNTNNSQTTQDQAGVKSKALIQYIPYCENGSVLITTRRKDVALQLVEERHTVAIEPMDGNDAFMLLQNKLGDQEDSFELIELATALEHMPLAIVQAAAYIMQRRPRYSVQQYLRDFSRSEKKRARLLKSEAGHLRRDREAKNSIILTWQMSFEHVRQIQPSASDLLAVMSFYDNQGIPDFLLRTHSRQRFTQGREDDASQSYVSDNELESDIKLDSDEESEKNEEFESDVLTLRNYSFIALATDDISFEMHALIQLSIRSWLRDHNEEEKWQQQSIMTLRNAWEQTQSCDDWTALRSLLPHAKLATEQEPRNEALLLCWIDVLHHMANYETLMGNEEEHLRLSLQAMEMTTKVLNGEHVHTLISIGFVVVGYVRTGRLLEAENLSIELCERSKKIYGADHAWTLRTMILLARIRRRQGRIEEAEKALSAIRDSDLLAVRKDHVTRELFKEMAYVYNRQGRWKEAEPLLISLLEDLQSLGISLAEKLDDKRLLAKNHRRQGRRQEAEALLVTVIDAGRSKLGLRNIVTMFSMCDLASIYWESGRWEAADALQLEILEAVRVFGTKNMSLTRELQGLADVCVKQDQIEAAEALQVEVVKSFKKVLGDRDPRTLFSMASLANIYTDQGRYALAEPLLSEVLDIYSKMWGPEHKDTLTTMNNLAWVLLHLGQDRWKEAETLLMQVVQVRKRVLGPSHKETLLFTDNLVIVYMVQHRYKDAEALTMENLAICTSSFEEGNFYTLVSMAMLAGIWNTMGRHVEAVKLLRDCVQIYERSLFLHDSKYLFWRDRLKEWEAQL